MKTIKNYNLSDIWEKNRKLITGLFFVLYLFVGLSIFKDYGISFDERRQRDYGYTLYNYVFHGKRELLNEFMRFHGPVFEFALFSLEKGLNLQDSREVYFSRHLATFLIFYLSVFFFYKLCKYRFSSWKMGLLGSSLLVLSPRIFADSFYNSKDIPFLAVFIICIYTLTRYLNKKTVTRAFVHALCCGILIALRVTGMILPFLTLIFFTADLFFAGGKKNKGETIFVGFFWYPLLTAAFTILFWPTLWKSPVFNFIFAVYAMGHYPWQGENLYLGRYMKAGAIPWHYLPVWIVITTPPAYLVLCFSGLGNFLAGFFRRVKRSYADLRDGLIFICWLFLPVSATIIFKSALYDGWRHVFFIYPAILIFAVGGAGAVARFLESKYGKTAKVLFFSCGLIYLLAVLVTMARLHPYQNVYFNRLAGPAKNMEKRLELDYWGLSYRRGLEYVLSHDNSRFIKVCAGDAGLYNSDILPAQDRARLIFTEKPEEADYFLGNFRMHKGDYPYGREYYCVKAGAIKILAVYRLR